MDEVIGFFCGIAVTAAVIAAVGHGLWVAVAAGFRFLSGTPTPHKADGTPDSDLAATRRQIQRWEQAGLLNAGERRRLLALVDPSLPGVQPGPAVEVSTPLPTMAVAPSSVPAESPVPMEEPVEADVVEAEVVDVHPADRDAPATQTVHPLDRATPIAPPIPPRASAPRRALADMLQAFMEQKNIRWVELLSGLLIVGCATGLVISLRAALKDKIPYFPALSFMLVSGAFHAAGLYSLRRWNLKSTSRGVLIIATLLVPLSVLAGIVLAGEGEQRRPLSDPAYWVALVVGLAGFGAMNYFASRALVRHGWRRMMVAVMGTCVGQILVSRLQSASMSSWGAALLLLPAMAAYLGATLAQLLRLRSRTRLGILPARQFLLELGVATFAVLAPVGLFVAKSDSRTDALRNLSPVLSLGAAAVLASGLFAHRRFLDPKVATFKTAGTGLALLGGALMLLMVGFAWPHLHLLIAVGLLNFTTLTVLALVGDLAFLNALAVGCLSFAYLGAFFLWRGVPAEAQGNAGTQLVQAIFRGSSGGALTVFTTIAAGIGIGLLAKRRRDSGLAYLIASGGLAGVCIGIAAYASFWGGSVAQGNWSTAIFGYFAVAALVAAWFTGRLEATWLGSALVLAASIHALWLNDWLGTLFASWGWTIDRPVLVATLLHSLAAASCAGVLARVVRRPSLRSPVASMQSALPDSPAIGQTHFETIVAPLSWSGWVTSLAAAPFALAVANKQFGAHAAYLFAICCPWLVVAVLQRAKWAWGTLQVLVAVALAYSTTWLAMRQDWWTGDPWYDPRHLHWQFVVLAAECVGWILLRKYWNGKGEAAKWMPLAEQAVDPVLMFLLVIAVTVSTAVGCLPGVWHELGISGFSTLGSSSHPVQGFVAGHAWLPVVALFVALGVALWERHSLTILLALVLASATVPFVLAGQWNDQQATASALRWWFALAGAAWCLPACYFGGTRGASSAWIQDVHGVPGPADVQRAVSLLFSVSFVVGLTTAVLIRVASGAALGGPDPASVFARMGSSFSYATPLAVLVLVLFIYAVRESRAGFAGAASLVFQYFITLACLLPVLSTGGELDSPAWAKALQWNAIGFGIFTAIWGASRRWIEPETGAKGTPARSWSPRDFELFSLQFAAMLLVSLAISVWIAVSIMRDPTGNAAAAVVLGQWPSYLAIILAAAGIVWMAASDRLPYGSHVILFLSLVLFTVVAATVHHIDTAREWRAYHALVVGRTLFAAIAAGLMCWRMRTVPLTAVSTPRDARFQGVFWGSLGIALSFLAAFSNIGNVPSRGWETGAACGAAVVAAVLGIRSRLQPFDYAALAFAGIATLLFHSDLPAGHPLRTDLGSFPQVGFVLMLAAIAWLGWEVWFQRRGELGVTHYGMGAAHRFVARAMMVVALLIIGTGSLRILLSPRPLLMTRSEVGAFVFAFAAYFLLHFASLWDRRGRYATLGLYLGLMMISAFTVDLMPWQQDRRRVAFLGAMAFQVALTGWIWSWGGKLATVGARSGMFDPVEQLRRTSVWLIVANVLLSIEVLIASTLVVLGAEMRELRVSAACLPWLVAAGIAGIAQQHRRDAMQLAAILIASWGATLLGWSDIEPDNSMAFVLARAIRLLIAWAAAAFVLGVIGVRVLSLVNPWRNSARRAAVVLATGSIAALLAVLGLETVTFRPGEGAPVEPVQVAAVSVVLVGLIAALISLAVLPGRDPLALTERGRMTYVYGAQAVAGLLFAHIYLAIPSLFQGTLRPYWPYIVLVIAFAGVGVGTLFERLGWRVLAEPFQRSGAFMPVIPVLGMWLVSSQSNYSTVLFVIGLLYMLISFSQKSAWAGAAAAIAGNGSLWSLLNGAENLTFGSHPQFWLIPPAISALVAAQLNRDRLTNTQLAAIRYVAMGVIYLSSSVEMLLIVRIGESLWPPVILICLAMLGVAFGIAMQVRAFLYLGSVFVLVSLVSMVAHASKSIDHVWPWWAFGIGMGVVILVVFGYFESRREQVLALIERLRQWQK